jgi:hypothetical protein
VGASITTRTSLRHSLSTNSSILHVDPSLVLFDFKSGIPSLNEANIMIDPAGIIDSGSCVSVCHACQKSLKSNKLPPESLANHRWVGFVPPQLYDLTWMEELLIGHANLTGRIIHLQNRNTTNHFSLKATSSCFLRIPQNFSKQDDMALQTEMRCGCFGSEDGHAACEMCVSN